MVNSYVVFQNLLKNLGFVEILFDFCKNFLKIIPASLAVNTYTAKITYGGETNILGKTIKINVVVNRATLKLTAANKKFKLKDKTKKYAVALKTDKNKVYKYKKISLKVNGKVYHANTNKKGIATFKLSKLIKK